MSVEAVNQFLQNVGENSQLQEELSKALEAENDKEAVIELAGKYGYQLTSNEIELWRETQNRQSEFQQRQQAGELNEEELEAVAGGAVPVATPKITQNLPTSSVYRPQSRCW